MNPRWLLMMKRWAQNPPSSAKIRFAAGIIAIALILYGIETLWGWPDALTPNNIRGIR
ncbi:hypothetical protein [Yoonia sp.]|uniref:hypothetical protein n=1 Tax=Yoonia sp. TaxID=2212373 RepID=UPI0023B5C132